ncbi:DUF4229 domain-containing protein [Isoptericola aurantiacus]|uniref:DUF4229 domain-containing protein n=1 Tax=Isoptericola aurantiacus TaxID=3377839 RepID=UPI00383BB8D7
MPLVIYTVLRLVIFAGALGVGYLVGLRGLLLVLVGVVVAFAVAYLALPRQKDAAAVWIAERAQRRAQGKEGLNKVIDEDAAAEDAAVDSDGGSPDRR